MIKKKDTISNDERKIQLVVIKGRKIISDKKKIQLIAIEEKLVVIKKRYN